MRVSEPFERNTLELDLCKKIIDRAVERGVQALSITGGEPLLYLDDVITLVDYAGAAGIKYTRTGTNGYYFRNPQSADFQTRAERIADKIAASSLRNFWISIDSADPGTHEKMRGFSGIIKGIETALPLFHERGFFPTANLGINRNLGGSVHSGLTSKDVVEKEQFTSAVHEGLRSFFTLVQNIGFTIVNFCYPMSAEGNNNLDAVYPASSPEHIVRFNTMEKGWLFETMGDVIPEFRSSIRIFSPLSSIHSLRKWYQTELLTPFPCRGGLDYFFINAGDGKTYPCGYRGQDCLGDYTVDDPLHYSSAKDLACTRCDWECFRDPSEFFGPLTHALRRPISLCTTYKRSLEFYRHWLSDIRYYRACNFFDGRTGIDTAKLAHFSTKTKPTPEFSRVELPC